MMWVPWKVHRVPRFDPTIRHPNQVVTGEKFWFFKSWPPDTIVDVVGIHEGSLWVPIENSLRFYVQFAKYYYRLRNYDLLVTHDAQSAFLFSFLRSATGLFRDIPHVLIDVGLPGSPERLWPGLSRKLKYFLLRSTFNVKSVSLIIYHSRCQAEFYREALGFPSEKLAYVPFGVETDYFAPVDGLDGGYAFAAGEYRDYDPVLQAYRMWGDSLPPLRVRSALARPPALPRGIQWLPRASVSVFREETRRSKFVILPLPSTTRSVGLMTLLQSMALGKAVIVSKVPSVDGYVIDGENAVYYDPENPWDLAQKILRLARDTELVRRIGRAARRIVEEEFNVDRMGHRMWNAIRRVVDA